MNIIELAKQAGFERLGHDDDDWVCYPEEIETFAALVAAYERKACAKVCEPQMEHDDPLTAWKIAKAIRARGTT
jgi:hypothetical protein